MNDGMWTDANILDFWKHNESAYAGDKKSRVVLKLTKHIIKGRKLDVGAGSGKLVSQLSNAIGVDIVAKPPFVHEGSIADLPFEDSTFDTVFATDVIEHLPQETLCKGLTEVRRVMKSDGHLIAVIPYKERMEKNAVFCPSCKKVFHRWGHLQVFDEDKVKSLFENADLRIKSVDLLPLGLMAHRWWLWKHWKLILATRILSRADVLENMDMLVVAEK